MLLFCCQCSKHKRGDRPDSNYRKDTHDAKYRREPHDSTYRRDPHDSSYRQDRSSRHDPRSTTYRRDRRDSTTYKHGTHDSPYKQDTHDPTYKRDSCRLHPHDPTYRHASHKTAFRRDKNDGTYWQELRESEFSINPSYRPGAHDSHYRHEPYDSHSRNRKTTHAPSYKHDTQGYYNYVAQPNGAFTAKESSSNDSVTSGRKPYTQGTDYKRSMHDTHGYKWERQDARFTPTQYSDFAHDSQEPSSRHTTDIDDTQDRCYSGNERSTQGPSNQQKTTIEHSIANTPTTSRLVFEDRTNYRWESKHNNYRSDDRHDPNDYSSPRSNYLHNSQATTSSSYVEKEPLSSPGPSNKLTARTSSRNHYRGGLSRGHATPDSGYRSDKPNLVAKRDVQASSGSDEPDDSQPLYRDTFDSGYKADNEGRVRSHDTSTHRHVTPDPGNINEEQTTGDIDEQRDEIIRQEARKNRHKYTAKYKTASSQRQDSREWMQRHHYFNSMLRRAIQRFPAYM